MPESMSHHAYQNAQKTLEFCDDLFYDEFVTRILSKILHLDCYTVLHGVTRGYMVQT